MKAYAAAALLLLVTAVLAGCSDSPAPQVITSADSVVHTPPPPRSEKVGHLAGHVLDPAYRTLEGIRVELPAYDLNDTTDRNGEFSFVDLPTGSYLLVVNATGYGPVRSLVDIGAGRFTRVQVVLEPIPPPGPWNETWEFEDYAFMTGPPLGWFHVVHGYGVDGAPGVHTLVVEAVMPPYEGVGSNGFRYRLYNEGRLILEGEGENPLRVEAAVVGTAWDDGQYELSLNPIGNPTPEFNKRMDVFITAFYNGPPPPDWSVA